MGVLSESLVRSRKSGLFVLRLLTRLLSFAEDCQLPTEWSRAKVCVTKVEIAASAGVEPQWRVARGAFLGLKFLDELVEACFVGDMAARQLQDALAAQRVFQRLLACCALCADQGALSSRFWTGSIDHVAEFVVDCRGLGRGWILRLVLLQTRRVWAVMQTSERGEASSRRLGRGRDGCRVSRGSQIATP